MSFETAKTIIVEEFKYVKESSDFDEIEFDFTGGEPFLEFELIKNIVDWTKKKKWDVPYLFFVQTNGTLINDDIKMWLIENRCRLHVGVSYDGTPEMQEENRNTSDIHAGVDFFTNLYPEQPVKMTISNKSVYHLADGLIYLHERGIKVIANCAYGLEWSDDDIREFYSQLMKLSNYYLSHPNIKPTSLFDERLRFLLFKKLPTHKYCGTGTHMVAYDVDGKRYPCHLFTPLVLGDERAQGLSERIKFEDSTQHTDERCHGCSLLPICPTCYGFNFRDTGSISKRNSNTCKLFRTQMDVYSHFKTMQYRKKVNEKDNITSEDYDEMRGILYLYDNPPTSLS
jgi:radical SAM protein with 4Fe4S-binding SPASM domain